MRKTLACRLGFILTLANGFALSLLAAEKAAPLSTFATLPIKEITVFKDGHAFVAHEGELPVDERGNVVMDYLPTPVIGTFWPYAAGTRARLAGVVAGQKRVLAEHTALNLRELLEANVGADAIICEGGTNRYEAKIVGFPERNAEEQASASPPYTSEKLPEKGNLILLKTAEGVKAMPVDRIQDVIFKSAHKTAGANEEFRNLLTLRLDWANAKPAKSARVGLFYLQKGVRWIPSYKVELDGQGSASVKLQGTLLNELADLDDIPVNLVVGVPTFAFKDTVDPMALQQNLAQLSQYFQPASAVNSPLAYNFSNAMMTQVARPAGFGRAAEPAEGGALGPDIGDSGKSEDLYVYTVPHVKLRKGERMVLTVAEFKLPYKDLFTLDVPYAPPVELRGNFNSEQQRELARLFNAPKAMHTIRLTNNSKYPLTTAPALLIRDQRVLAQGMMTYAAAGASVDLPLTAAVDIQVGKHDLEARRTPAALRENGIDYTRIDLSGKITLTNRRAQPVELEVTRSVLGGADRADHEGKVEKISAFEDDRDDYPYWWNWYGWPDWWGHFNGFGRVTWELTLESGQQAELGCDWHYFWR
jgi:hypothetical protein